MDSDNINTFIFCEKCGKKLLQRKPNGIFVFRFGRNNQSKEPTIEIEIHGSLRIRCFRKKCGHINLINYFP